MCVIMAIAMVAMLAFGGTYAYFTATADGVSGRTTTGVIELTTEKTTVNFVNTAMLPTETTTQTITYTDNSTRATYVFWEITTDWAGEEADPTEAKAKIAISKIKVGETEITAKTVTSGGHTAYYIANGKDKTDGTGTQETANTNSLVLEITLVMSGESDNVNGADTDNVMGRGFTVTIVARAIQQQNFNDAQAAYAHWYPGT